MTPRFLLAKFVPDLSRMEPRNIGVFLWAKGDIRSRFLTDDEANFIGDKENYARWQKFWNGKIGGTEIKPERGVAVSKSKPECMDALMTNQAGQFILVDAGDLLRPIGKRELREATDYLFQELVAPASLPAHVAARGFSEKCDGVISKSGLSERGDFHKKYKIECAVFGSKRPLRFSYGIGNGTPLAVFQRIQLSSEQSVNSGGLLLHEITDRAIVDKANCAALVQKSEVNSEIAEDYLKWLTHICQIIDIDEHDAPEQIKSLVPFGHSKA